MNEEKQGEMYELLTKIKNARAVLRFLESPSKTQGIVMYDDVFSEDFLEGFREAMAADLRKQLDVFASRLAPLNPVITVNVCSATQFSREQVREAISLGIEAAKKDLMARLKTGGVL